jgi:hypothetical protein
MCTVHYTFKLIFCKFASHITNYIHIIFRISLLNIRNMIFDFSNNRSPESPKYPPAWIEVLYENALPSPDTGPGGSATTVSQPRIQNTRDYSIRMIGWSIISGGALRSGLAVVSFLIACSTSTTRSVVPDGTRGDTWPRSRLTSLSSPPHLHLHLKARLPS